MKWLETNLKADSIFDGNTRQHYSVNYQSLFHFNWTSNENKGSILLPTKQAFTVSWKQAKVDYKLLYYGFNDNNTTEM